VLKAYLNISLGKCGGAGTKCCGTESYDPELHICCNGVVRPKTYGEESYCCGEYIYTPKLALCCGDYVKWKMGRITW
jgi:hypothetical protein